MSKQLKAIVKEEPLVPAAVFLAVLLGPATAGGSETTTYHCDAAERQAVIGTFSDRKVAAYLNYADDECRFSIDGAPVGSPPLDRILSGLNAIDAGEMSGQIASGQLRLLGDVMMAAAPVGSAPPEVVAVLREFAGDAYNCFKAFEGQMIVGDVIATDGVLCRVGVPTGEPLNLFPASEAERQGLRVVGQQPQLQIAVAAGDSEYFLFVPVSSQ